jgi:hypothetical protein
MLAQRALCSSLRRKESHFLVCGEGFVSAEIQLKTPKKQKEEQTLFVPLSAKPC